MNKEIEDMARYIHGNFITHDTRYIEDCRAIAQELHSADYRKQRVGRWIEHDDDWCGFFYTCSSCGCDWTTIDGTPQDNNMRFCPECGAKMEGESDERKAD